MRSIGKVKIKKLKALCNKHFGYFQPLAINQYQCKEAIKADVPDDWYDTWESAWSEIERIISDEITNKLYGKD